MTEFDILRFARIQVLGVTSPQVYLKVKGNWTGGHQENLAARACNINHGPGKSLWHCIGNPEDINKFRKKAKDIYGIDIILQEGLWFADIDFCLGNNIPVVTFNQKPGDMVILGPGTQHWVKSLGLTT